MDSPAHNIRANCLWLLPVLCLLASLQAMAASSDDTAMAAAAGLTSEQADRLAELGAPGPIPVAVPAYVPQGFHVVGIRASGDQALDVYVYYSIRYAASDGTCFTIESKTLRLIRSYRDPLLPVEVPIFANTAENNARIFWSSPDVAPIAPGSVFAGWLGAGPRFYRLASGPMVAEKCGNIGSATAARIVESLRWLPATAPAKTDVDPFDSAAYADIAAESVEIPMRQQHPSPARHAAMYVLDTLGLVDGARRPDNLRTKMGHMGPFVLVTYAGLDDDAIAARRYLIKMFAYGHHWLASNIGVQYRCRPGHGHRNWSQQPCR